MIPLGDDKVKNAKNPWVTWLVILLNIGVYSFEWNLSITQLEGFIEHFGVIPSKIASFQGWDNLLSALFIHGGIKHLLLNMLFLYIFGDNIENILGKWGFLLFYLFAGIVSMLTHSFVNPYSNTVCIGASGAISGVLGAYIYWFPKNRVTTLLIIFPVRVSAYIFLGVWFATQLTNGFNYLDSYDLSTEVAWFTHIGGFAFGLFFAIIYKSMGYMKKVKIARYD